MIMRTKESLCLYPELEMDETVVISRAPFCQYNEMYADVSIFPMSTYTVNISPTLGKTFIGVEKTCIASVTEKDAA